jgi:signal peptidase I
MSIQENNNEDINEIKQPESPAEKKSELMEWVKSIVLALIVAVLIRYLIFAPTIVKGESMVPTLQENNRLIAERISVLTGKIPHRGDIVTFEAPTSEYFEPRNTIAEKLMYTFFLKKDYIKRVIATEGERVQIKDGKVFVNGEELKEPYLDNVATEVFAGDFSDLVVPKGTIFVLGDNRGNSTDGRKFGPISLKTVEGRVVFRFWPLNEMGTVK